MAARYGRSAKYEQALRLSKKGLKKRFVSYWVANE
jgi:hypothetical protein